MLRAMGLAPDRAETLQAAQGEAGRPGDAEGGRRPDPPTPTLTMGESE